MDLYLVTGFIYQSWYDGERRLFIYGAFSDKEKAYEIAKEVEDWSVEEVRVYKIKVDNPTEDYYRMKK